LETSAKVYENSLRPQLQNLGRLAPHPNFPVIYTHAGRPIPRNAAAAAVGGQVETQTHVVGGRTWCERGVKQLGVDVRNTPRANLLR